MADQDAPTPGTETSFAESTAAPETQAPAQSPETSSQPSAAETPGKTPKESMLDAVLKVVPATTEKPLEQAAKDKSAPPDAQAESGDQAEPDESGDDDEQPPPEASPATRKNINKLLRQRRELRERERELTEHITIMEPAAEIGVQLHRYASENDLSGDDVRMALTIAASLRRGDYQAFYEAVAQPVRRAQEYLGLVLPVELAQRVNKGDMTEATAKELARQHYDQQLAEVVHTRTQQQSLQMVREQTKDSVARAVTAYEHQIAANDPDYKAKAGPVQQYAKALLFERGGTINTVQDALDITQKAYAEVNRQFKALLPAPRATNVLPMGSSPSMNGARPAPRTMMEAALQGLENAHRQT